ncbi:hypothetical protein [Clostridium senegalense]|uniref:Corrinoid adenosyltransferase n=1 Tax=Clostridium senegalense TaxID=1465809 RepID=A0A6M0H1X0_9CLOT|nr:hypothetical protein [Clostridium senegalense]NEU04579.1 hypothetical protein [Clostridium senegalense]
MTKSTLFINIESNASQLNNAINYLCDILEKNLKIPLNNKFKIISTLTDSISALFLINKEISTRFKSRFIESPLLLKLEKDIDYIKTLYPSSFKPFIKTYSLEGSYCGVSVSITTRLRNYLIEVLNNNESESLCEKYCILLEKYLTHLYNYIIFIFTDDLVLM